MTAGDYRVMDTPAALRRRVEKPDPLDPDKWVRDDEWYEDHKLIKRDSMGQPIEKVILKLSDFTETGKKLLHSGAVDRWLDSFDRPGSKKSFSNVRYLEKALRALS